MKLHNKSKHAFQHSIMDEKMHLTLVTIEPNEIKEVDDAIAKIWLKTGDIVEYVAPAEVKAKEEQLLKRIQQLEKENAALKDKNDNKCPLDIEALKKEADELGVKYNPNIGAEKLLAKINEFKESKAVNQEDKQ